MRINKHDTNGTKPLLGKGELGYDDYTAGGDTGRVYVGKGDANVALAKKSEVDTKVDKVASTDNAIVRFDGTSGQVQNSSVTINDSGNINTSGTITSTGGFIGNASTSTSAAALQTPRTISLTGDITGSAVFDGSANASITATIAANSVALGTDTTGNYVAGNTAGTGITISGTAGEGWSPTISLSNVGTAGTYTKVTTNAQGQVTSGTSLSASDIPSLDASKITTGIIDAARLPAFVDDVLEFANQASFPATGESGKIYVALDTNKAYRWSGSVYVYITSGAVDSVNGQTGVVNITTITGNAGTATKLQTSRNIALAGAIVGSVNFDGSADVSISTTLGAQSFIQSSGLITSWGATSGTSTGAVNVVMGTSNSATWLLSGTSGGVFRSGIQSLDSNGTLRLYSNSNYIEINGNQIAGNISTASALSTGRTIGMTGDVTWTSASFNGSANVTGTATLANSGVTAGTYKSVTVDAKGRVTSGTNPTTLAGYGITDATPSSHVGATGTAHGNATTSVAGFMSNTDKTKLDGIAASANNYVHPTSGVTSGSYAKVTVDANGHVTAGATPTMEDIPDASFKRSVRCATTANIAATYASNVLTSSAVGVTVIDGITVALNDRILIKDQSTSAHNGIYRVSVLGTASVATVFTRTNDADTSSKIASALVAVDSGTLLGGKLFDNDFKTTDTLGTTALIWNANLNDGSLLTAGSTAIGMVKYNGTTLFDGQFDGGTSTPTGTKRLNYGGYFYPSYINLTGSADTTTASSHVFVETGSDGFVRPKTLANFKTEMFASPTLVTPNIGAATATSLTISGTGTIISRVSNVAATLTDLSTGITNPFVVPNINVGTTYGYIPMMSTGVLSSAGYRTNISIGAYRPESTWNNSGVYIAVGGNDSYPTEAFILKNGGKLESTLGAITMTGHITGNANTATTLQTARLIGGVSFNGSADITLPGVNAVGNQNTTGSAASLTTARTIAISGGVSGSAVFNGSSDITINATVTNASHTHTSANISDATNANTANMIVKRDASGNFSAGTITAALTGNASTATTLQTARTINGVSFNGSANINIEDRLGSAIASAATTTVGTAGLGDYMHITGTTTITSFGTASAPGVRRTLIFDGALQITHNSTSLICPGAANIVTIAGTVIEVVSETTANWRVVSITHPSVSMAELGYLDGVTSNIQTQLNTDVVRNLGVKHVQAVVGDNQQCTTAQFVTWLNTIGAFNYRQCKFICGFYYAGNNVISDVLGAQLSTAGCTIEVSSESLTVYTITVTSPNTSNSTIPGGGIHIYNNNGAGYSPGWRRVYTDRLNGTATNIIGDLDSTGRNLVLSQRLIARGTGNGYTTAGVEVYGNGSTIVPMIGFHQPGLYAATIELQVPNRFDFMNQGRTGFANIAADNGTFTGSVTIVGTLNVSTGGSNATHRVLYCDTNRIGFLNSSGNWGAWCNNDGSWQTSGVNIGGFGWGQSWNRWGAPGQGRDSGVTYTNNTARPIFVTVSGNNSYSDGSINAYVDGALIAHSAGHSIYGHEPFVSFIVPVGSTYKVDIATNGGWTMWAELR